MRRHEGGPSRYDSASGMGRGRGASEEPGNPGVGIPWSGYSGWRPARPGSSWATPLKCLWPRDLHYPPGHYFLPRRLRARLLLALSNRRFSASRFAVLHASVAVASSIRRIKSSMGSASKRIKCGGVAQHSTYRPPRTGAARLWALRHSGFAGGCRQCPLDSAWPPTLSPVRVEEDAARTLLGHMRLTLHAPTIVRSPRVSRRLCQSRLAECAGEPTSSSASGATWGRSP